MNNLSLTTKLSIKNKVNFWRVEQGLGASVEGSRETLRAHFEDWEHENKV